MDYKENEGNLYNETLIDYVSNMKSTNISEYEADIQEFINYQDDQNQENEEVVEEILPLDQAISIIDDNNEELIIKMLKIFLMKLNEMDFVYSPDFNESGFLNHLITLIGHDNPEISHLASRITATLAVSSNELIEDLVNNEPLGIFFFILNKETKKSIVPSDPDDIGSFSFNDDRSLYFALITLSVLVSKSYSFRNLFIENKGLNILFGVVQSHSKDSSIIKEINRLLFFLTRSVFNEDQVEEDFSTIAEIYLQTKNIEPKSAIKFVLNIAQMDYFYQVFLQHGVINYFVDYIKEVKSYTLVDQVLAICASFAKNDPMIFLDALPRLILFLESKDQDNNIVYGTCILLEEILPAFIEYSMEEEEFDESGNLLPQRQPLLDDKNESESDSITIIGILQDSLLLRIGIALIDKINESLYFTSLKSVINVFFLILKNSNPFICGELSTHNLISLLITFLDYDDVYYRSETMHALDYLFDLEIKVNNEHNLIEEFLSLDGKEILESFLESPDDDFVQQANSLISMIDFTVPDNMVN